MIHLVAVTAISLGLGLLLAASVDLVRSNLPAILAAWKEGGHG